jgi:hypothetical protein
VGAFFYAYFYGMKLRWLSYLLILSFSVLFTPRHWWHDCHAGDAKEIHSGDTVIKKNDCFACDYHIPFAPLAFSPLRLNSTFHSSVPLVVRLDQKIISVPLSLALRGPPCC